MLGTGCADRGCTDPAAENYDPFAQRNNGTCIYRGCTDPNASNYNPQATQSDGSCIYPVASGELSLWSSVQCCALEVLVDGAVVGTIEEYYQSNPGCVNGNGIIRVSLPAGDHLVSARSITGPFYEWPSDTVTITANQCLTYEFSL